LDTKKGGEAQGKSCKDCTPLSLTHLHRPRPPTSIKLPPGGCQDPTCQPLHSSTSPFPLSPVPMPTRVHRWRPRLRQHAWPPSLANSLAGPSTPRPNDGPQPNSCERRPIASLWPCRPRTENAQSEPRIPSRGRAIPSRAAYVPARHREHFPPRYSL
jgi:hypothetical protein